MKLVISLFIILLPCYSFADVNIRLKNGTNHDMHNVSVNFRGQVIEYGSIDKGSYSRYFKVDHAYRYALVRWTADNTVRRMVPEDYVGEIELKSGKYTYVILPIKGTDNFWVDLQKD